MIRLVSDVFFGAGGVLFAASELSEFLAQAGGTVGGAAAITTVLAVMLAALLHDLGYEVSTARFMETGAAFGGVFGLAVLVWDALGA